MVFGVWHDVVRGNDAIQQLVEHYPQLSPVVIHSRAFHADEIPPTGQPLRSGPHQFADLTTQTIAHHRRPNSLGSRECHPYPAGCRISGKSQRQTLVPNDPALSKRGEADSSRNATDHADKRARPLERRDFKTARPPLVFIRLRNPCFFARRRLLG